MPTSLFGLEDSIRPLNPAMPLGSTLGFNNTRGRMGASLGEVSIQTTYWGTRPELVEVLDLGARSLLTPKTTQFGLDDALDAYDQMAAGKLDGRAVIVP